MVKRKFTEKAEAAETPRRPKTPRAEIISASCSFDGCGREFRTPRGARQHERSCSHRTQPVDTGTATPDPFRCADCGGRSGPVETKVRRDIEALTTAHPMGEALAEMAFALAHRVDASRSIEAAESRAIGAISKELRACLVELARLAESDDDDLEDLLSEPEMPTEVRDPEDP